MHLLMIFIDGFGLGREDKNPIVAARTPYLDNLLGGHYLWGERRIKHNNTVLCPLDACLGIPGVPQSATGQTTLWTGVNAGKVLGFHMNAYPNQTLKKIIEEKSIFRQLAEQGKQVMFANTFTNEFEDLVAEGKKRMTASTLSALAGGVKLRRVPDLLKGKAVYQDMTNGMLRERGYDVPLYTPYEAGQNLGRLVLEYDFTLYEFFQTDKKGHKQLWEESIVLIERIDSLIGGLMSVLENEDAAWLLTSDHGNIEDFSVKGHTLNRVPALAWSNQPIEWPNWNTLEDITPGIIKLVNRD